MKKSQKIISFIFALQVCIFISVEVRATSKEIDIKKNNIYIVGSNIGSKLISNHNSNFLLELQKIFNVKNFSKSHISVYDQLDILEKIPVNSNVLILLENYYLESLLYEINYYETLCKKADQCKKISKIPYSLMYTPLINLLHKRLDEMFLFNKRYNIQFLVLEHGLLNQDIIKKKQVIQKIDYFRNKKHYCFAYSLEIKEKNIINCLLKNLIS
jgi:hypothetical protein